MQKLRSLSYGELKRELLKAVYFTPELVRKLSLFETVFGNAIRAGTFDREVAKKKIIQAILYPASRRVKRVKGTSIPREILEDVAEEILDYMGL